MENKNIITIHTDGACSGNPGPGGWGAVLRWKENVREINGFEADSTNNRMELTAVIEALSMIKKSKEIHVHTDSQYVKKGITVWIFKWRANNWNKGKVKNVDLWKKLFALDSKHRVSWFWVKAHAGDKYNERADSLAREGIEKGA